LRTGGDGRRIHTIHNGVDPESFPPQIGEPDVPTISWVGRIDPLKDLITLIDAFAIVRRSVPNARLRLFGPIPVGNGDRGYHDECLRRVADHGLGGAVSFEGHIDRVSLAHEAGHIVALSSISEGFPFTVIEAMMSGRATVSTDVGGVGEAVGTAGVLVRPRDADGFAAALLSLLTDDSRRQRLGRAARERALSMFTLDRMADLYRLVYRSAVNPEVAVRFPPPPDPAAMESSDGNEIQRDPLKAVGGRS
jgi:glycosyltransferase involved in cell wall biosynthesis